MQALHESLHVVVLLVEATKNLKDEGTILDDLAEGVTHAIHLAAVVSDGELSLDKDAELDVGSAQVSRFLRNCSLIPSQARRAMPPRTRMISMSSVVTLPNNQDSTTVSTRHHARTSQ